MRIGIALKINLILVAVVLCLGSVTGILFVVTQKKHLSEELTRRVELFGGYMAKSIAHAVTSSDLAIADRQLKAAALDKEIAYVMVKSADGEILAARWVNQTTGSVSEYAFPLRLENKSDQQRDNVPFGNVSSGTSGVVGQLTIGVDLTFQHTATQKLIWSTVAIILIATTATLIVGLMFIRILLKKSLLPLVVGIGKIGEGDLDYRFNITNNDEIAEIGRSFNDMSDRLSATLVSKQKLETIVEERTSALNTALEERILLTEQLIQSQKMESIGRLAGGVAHDFNNLLTPIIGYSELLKLDISEGSPGAARLENVLKAADRAKDLISQLLSFSRKQILEMKTVDLNQTLENLLPMLRRTIRENIDIRFALTDNMRFISADASRIDQIIMNLVVNAQDAIPEKGTITIETAVVQLDDEYISKHSEVEAGKYLMLAITDNGIGMNQETKQHIFEPFFTTKGVGKGTGLGLATVYGIVRQHGGSIWVYSEPDRGTTFKIYFPLADAPQASTVEETSEIVELSGSKRVILVVEDNEMVRGLVNEMLSHHGFEVLTADCCQAALQISTGRILDLLVTDVVMPDFSGPALYRQLLPAHPGLKVLYMSGYTNNTIVHHGVLDEGVNFIQKPFSMNCFAEKIKKMITS